MLQATPEEALFLSNALMGVPDIWNKPAALVQFARMSYRAHPKTVISNASARIRFVVETQ